MDVEHLVVWERFAPILKRLIMKLNGFLVAKEACCGKINTEYFHLFAILARGGSARLYSL
jgi:hypothetical protein